MTTTGNYPMVLCSTWVPGSPKTKGSLTVVNSGRGGRRAHVEDTPESRRWRMFMVERIRAWRAANHDNAAGWYGEPFPGAVSVEAVFYQAVKPEDWVRKVAGSGDVDKLLRNLFDALSVNDKPALGAGVILDDMQIVGVTAYKQPAAWGNTGDPGMLVTVRKVSP